VIAFAIILGGAFAGVYLRKTLPEHHLTDDRKILSGWVPA